MGYTQLSSLSSENRAWIEEQQQLYQRDPTLVDPSWRQFFETLDSEPKVSLDQAPVKSVIAQSQPQPSRASQQRGDAQVQSLVDAYRTYGHLMAEVNPMRALEVIHGEHPPVALQPKTHGINLDSPGRDPFGLSSSSLVSSHSLSDSPRIPLSQLIERLRAIYCGVIGYEYRGVEHPEIQDFIQKQLETPKPTEILSKEEKLHLLHQLTRSELFERFLHRRYTGQKRFSVEGGDTVIPMLQQLTQEASALGYKQCILGMAHRGRLNVLAHVLDKSYEAIFSEFEESYAPKPHEGSGDVKYHKGFFTERNCASGNLLQILLCPNPSHLESVYPVVEGQTRARCVQLGDEKSMQQVLPIVLHGDGALAGQGVVYETLQMCKLEGYKTGGTIHIVLNNQVGFTTSPSDARSTRYCTDLARCFDIPVFHLNAEHPEECLHATKLALQLRHQFGCDVFLDLNCYRKFGHNETDEPAFTQPKQSQWIAKQPSIRELYRDQLLSEGVLDAALAEKIEKTCDEELVRAQAACKEQKQPVAAQEPEETSELLDTLDTTVSKETLFALTEKFCQIPEDFHPHPKIKQLCATRLQMARGEIPCDWGMAETLAMAVIVSEGMDIRLSGQDCGRGTFSHRHGLWVDQENQQRYYPLAHLSEKQGRFDLYNSHLSEYAALGFEFGYSAGYPEACVLWEAQFGDFANGAQIIIDQYIATAEQKWGLSLDLILLLPHGYEGQGPEHSSARLERFLSLCGNDNFCIIYPTTPAQLFHLLRRQQKTTLHKPLVLFTPKGLLRHPSCVSSIEELAQGSFQEIIEEIKAPCKPEEIHTLVLCTGRFYYDLAVERAKQGIEGVTLLRIEQLYPLPGALEKVLHRYGQAKRYVWAQEEPQNMGAWGYIEPHLRSKLPGKEWEYIGRRASASPAAGYYARHRSEHQELMDALYKGNA